MSLMKYSVEKNLTADVPVYNPVGRNGKRSVGSDLVQAFSLHNTFIDNLPSSV